MSEKKKSGKDRNMPFEPLKQLEPWQTLLITVFLGFGITCICILYIQWSDSRDLNQMYYPPPQYMPPPLHTSKEENSLPKIVSFENDYLLPVTTDHDEDLVDGSGSEDEDLSFCLKSFDVTSSPRPLKVCLVSQGKSSKDAAKYCESKAMRLLNIENDEIKLEVFDEMAKIFGTGGGTVLWIDGIYNENQGKWISQHDGEYLNVDVEFGQAGRCLTISSYIGTKYKIDSTPCFEKPYFLCQKDF